MIILFVCCCCRCCCCCFSPSVLSLYTYLQFCVVFFLYIFLPSFLFCYHTCCVVVFFFCSLMMIKLLLDDNSFLQLRFFLSQFTSCIQSFFFPCFMLSCFILKALVCLCVCVCVLSSVFVADRGSQRAIVFGKVEREREREEVRGSSWQL